MDRFIKYIAVVVLCYFSAWLVAFFFVVGFTPSLIPSYFFQGWSFSGLEMVLFVWLLAWPIFFVILAACYFARRRIHALRARAL